MMKKEMKVIYKVTNQATGKVYIGATTKSMEKRKEDHLQKAHKKIGNCFQQAIATYGVDAFTWTQIDTANTVNELADKEKKYIIEYNSKEQGYNSDAGGGFKKTVYQYNLEGSLNTTFEDLTSAALTTNVRKQDISRACLSVNHTLGGFLWSYEYKVPFVVESDNRKKQVVQYNLKGEKLASYISASEASRKTGISKTCITRCCRGERKNSGGFIWEYL